MKSGYSRSIVNKPNKYSIGNKLAFAGDVTTMKNTIINNSYKKYSATFYGMAKQAKQKSCSTEYNVNQPREGLSMKICGTDRCSNNPGL